VTRARNAIPNTFFRIAGCNLAAPFFAPRARYFCSFFAAFLRPYFAWRVNVRECRCVKRWKRQNYGDTISIA
jgi:hypothetical protein